MRPVILLVSFLCFGCSPSSPENYDLIISNVNLIDGTGKPMQEKTNVYIKEGRIVRIDKEAISMEGHTIDGSGQYLIPGLIDCHTHPNPYDDSFPKFIHYGVTSILVTGCSLCTNEYYSEMEKKGSLDSIPAPRIYHTSQHVSMEGRHPAKTYPSSNWVDGKTIFYLTDTLQIEALIGQLAEQPIVGIKLTIEDGPLPPFVDRMPQEFVNKVVKKAAKNGLEVFAHISDNKEFAIAQRAGVRNYLHYVMIDLNWNSDSTMIKELADNHASIVTTLMLKKSWLYPLRPDWLERLSQANVYDTATLNYLSDPARKIKSFAILKGRKFMTDENIPSLYSMIRPQVEDLKMLMDNDINVALGTDTGNDFILPGISLHEEMQIMELGGFTPMEIIKMTTFNAARILKQLDSLGSIEVGKFADMILLDKNPLESIENAEAIKLVLKNGKIQKRIDQKTTTNKI